METRWARGRQARGLAVVGLVAAIALAIGELPPTHGAALVAATIVFGALVLELERSRRRLAEEHAAHLAKNAYLANMSHELRTPLNAIIGFSEVIRDEMLGPIGTSKYGEFAADIHIAGSHLLDLINDVLELSRIEAGRLVLQESDTELHPLLVSCHRLMAERARRAGVILDMEVGNDLPMLCCDAVKLKQVLLNLLTNAIKFTPRGGTVTLSTACCHGALTITVADSGVGIAAKDIPRVLTPFVQAAHTRTLSDEGSGLGLPLAKRLMELHGGTLSLESRLGHGTRVTVTVPPQRCSFPLHAVAAYAVAEAA